MAKRQLVVLVILAVVFIASILWSRYCAPDTASTEVPLESSSEKGYVLTLKYGGQQGAGVRSLLSQQCWAESFHLPMYIVEPFIEESICGIPSDLTKTENVLRMSDFFDIDHFNEASRNDGYAEVASWEDFLRSAPRKVIVIQERGFLPGQWYWKKKTAARGHPKVEWEASLSNHGTATCFRPGFFSHCYAVDKMQHLVDYHDFCVVRIVSFDAPIYGDWVMFSESEMYRDIFGRWKPEEVTVLVSYWCDNWYVPNPNLETPSLCADAYVNGFEGKYVASKQITQHVKKYEKAFYKSRNPKLAIMLRLEHTVKELGSTTEGHNGVYTCLKNLINLKNELSPEMIPFVTADIGKYGSISWKKTLKDFKYSTSERKELFEAIRTTVVTLLDNTLNFEEWEDTFIEVSGIEDRGYIAALQRTIASRADCLVLVGGGHFLEIALHEYLRDHPSSCVHFICLEKQFKDEYTNILVKNIQNS